MLASSEISLYYQICLVKCVYSSGFITFKLLKNAVCGIDIIL